MTATPDADEAVVRYETPDFIVLKSGAYVRCAVTGARIPLEALTYWSVELQEAYSDARHMTARWLETR